MAASEDLLALTKVTSEIDDSQSKIIFTNQCIKAQDHLCSKLKQEIKRQEEIWYFMKKDNQKLEAEIKNAENEIKCSSTADDAIRCSNVELRKELLVTKETYAELVQRIKDGDNKYDTMWLEAKQRFEGIPFVQGWMTATQQAETLKIRVDVLDHEALMTEEEKRLKKRQVLAKERKLILNLAEFLNGYNAPIKAIKDKQEQVAKLSKEVETLKAAQCAKDAPATATAIDPLLSKLTLKAAEEADSKIVDENWVTLCWNIYDDSLVVPTVPRLQPPTMDNDALNVKLDLKKDFTEDTSIRRTISISETENSTKRVTPGESLNEQYISSYLSKPSIPTIGNDTDTTAEYSKKKLINILDDIQLDENETYDIIAKTNPDHLQIVSVIGANPLDKNVMEAPKNVKGLNVSEEIEEIDLTAGNGNSQKILMPPSQFADMNEVSCGRKPQEGATTCTVMVNMSMEQRVDGGGKNASNVKKRVSFDIPMSVSLHDTSEDMDANNDAYKPNESIESITSQGDNANDDTFMNMREMLLKKHDLDLSPQFVYAKNNAIKKKTDENVVTSKFFETNVEANEKQTDGNANNKIIELEEVPDKAAANAKQCTAPTQEVDNQHSVVMDEDNMKSPPEEKPVAGMLFTHGPKGIPDCLDLSMSTTGYEEGDGDFPQYLDSSLLMSPKADNDMPPMSLSGNPPGVESQEVPNFLSGFKKASLSFFNPSPETSTDANPQNQENNFNFNFGGSSEEKKNKGLFSFFR